ncbi:hypothetical protein OKS35_06775 [Exiguobacterium sp. N5]|nr:hypothetical protein [Exiguobacterium sp. N5]MCV9899825.1 hypothetical protein [Exiguobacterium sp. N5]
MTPRKILALWDKHREFSGWKEPKTDEKTKIGGFHQTDKVVYAEQASWL